MAYAAPAGVSIQCKTMRHANEDRFTVIESIDDQHSLSFFAVYDGHCGDSCSAFLAEALHKYVTGSTAFQNHNFKAALSEGLLFAEKQYRTFFENQSKMDPNSSPDNPKPSAGSCAVVVIRTKTHLFIANLGDCRAVAAVNSMSKMLTRDHKASDPIEKARIVEAGGFVRSNRVFGLMSVTRSIGDFEYKLGNITGTLICTPELYEEEISAQHQCLILACDGLWDVVDNALAVETALEGLRTGKTAAETAGLLAELAQQRGSKDDITVIIIPLNV